MKLKICLIDSEIDLVLLKRLVPYFHGAIELLHEDRKKASGNPHNYHGTACLAQLIESLRELGLLPYVNLYAYSVQLNSTRTADELLCAIKFCCNYGINLISLSLGMLTSPNLFKVIDVLNNATSQLLCIASSSNSGHITFPASFNQVIGVRDSLHIESDMAISVNPLDGIDVVTHHRETRVSRLIEQIYHCSIGVSSSLATPRVCAHCADAIIEKKRFIKKDEMLRHLQTRYGVYTDAISPSTADDIEQPIVVCYYKPNDDRKLLLKQIKLLQHYFWEESYSMGVITDIVHSSQLENSIYRYNRKNNSLNQLLHYYANRSMDSLFFCVVPNSDDINIEADLVLHSFSLTSVQSDLAMVTQEIIAFFSN